VKYCSQRKKKDKKLKALYTKLTSLEVEKGTRDGLLKRWLESRMHKHSIAYFEWRKVIFDVRYVNNSVGIG
jgi:hypothetical protein